MDESTRITQKILLSILTGNQKVGEIRFDTRLSPKTLSAYLELLAKQRLIRISKGWKRGKSKPCFITDTGFEWLTNTPLIETLDVISKISYQMRNPKNREVFKKVQAAKYARNIKIITNCFIERALGGIGVPLEFPLDLDLSDPDQPFREVLKKVLSLHFYLISNSTPDEIEHNIESDFILIAPKTRVAFTWHPGSFPELEYQIQKVDAYYRNESDKLKEPEEGKKSSGQTHLLNLEKVDEKLFDEYVKETNKIRRERILVKIEYEAGWSVGAYLGKLLIGQKNEIASYVDGLGRPCLKQFISLFENGQSS